MAALMTAGSAGGFFDPDRIVKTHKDTLEWVECVFVYDAPWEQHATQELREDNGELA